MNKIKIRYSLRRFDLPESFNQSDVMIEVPFEYGMINIYPYYDTIEIIEYNSNGMLSLFVMFKGGIEELAIKTLDSLTREDLLNCTYKKSWAIPYCQAIKYEFKDLFYKLLKLTTSNFSKLKIDENNWCYVVKEVKENSVTFQSDKFLLRLEENENGNLNLRSYRANEEITYKDIEDFINLVKLNITNLEVIPN